MAAIIFSSSVRECAGFFPTHDGEKDSRHKNAADDALKCGVRSVNRLARFRSGSESTSAEHRTERAAQTRQHSEHRADPPFARIAAFAFRGFMRRKSESHAAKDHADAEDLQSRELSAKPDAFDDDAERRGETLREQHRES